MDRLKGAYDGQVVYAQTEQQKKKDTSLNQRVRDMSFDELQHKADRFVQTQSQIKWDMDDALDTRAQNDEILGQVIIPEYKVPPKPEPKDRHGVDYLEEPVQSLAHANQIPLGGNI